MDVNWSDFWTVAAAVAAIVGTIAALIFGYISSKLSKEQKKLTEKQNEIAEQQKELSIQMQPRMHLGIYIESYTPLIRTATAVGDDVEIHYKKQPVRKLASLQVKILNIGNKPVKSEDYYSLLEFSVKGLILEARQINQSDKGINFVPDNYAPSSSIKLEKTLLNQRDEATILITVAEDEEISANKSLEVHGRLIDGKIEYTKQEKITPPVPLAVKSKSEPIPFLEFSRTLSENVTKENWPILRDTIFLLILLLMAMAWMLDAIIPF